jgi:hypothetical protein
VAETRGRITQIVWQAEIVCMFVTTAPNRAELLIVQFLSYDSAFTTGYKRSLVQLLTTAFVSRREVRIFHGDQDPVVTGIDFLPPNISPVGPAIHNDFYSITGRAIPDNAEIVFDSGVLSVAVTPDVRRPHWLLIEQLPAAIPVGPCTVFLRAPGWQSDRVPITVFAGALQTARVLYSGRPTTNPYTFVFAATPALERASGGTVYADPILTNRADFHDVVRYCIENLLTVTESLLREESLEASVRFVTIFDTTQGATTANALARENLPNLLEPMRDRMNSFCARYGFDPDIVFCISGSTVFTRASAWFTTDDAAKPGVNFNYDGTARVHRRYTSVPGSAAMSTSLNQTGLTALHEFGHAASDFDNGMVVDLYVDDTRGGFVVNRKLRALPTNTIPANFGTYGGATFQSDQSRDGLGYPAAWRSYHAALQDATRPNLMDNYWLAAQPQRCRLDGLTFNWFRDRLRAKILRQ